MDQTKLVTLKNGYHLFTRKVNEGPVKLLCLHGGPGRTHETFDNFKEGLKNQGVEVYSYDQLGSYYSDQPDFTKAENKNLLSIPRYVDKVEEVRQKLGLDNFYLLGHSWGGLLAQDESTGKDFATETKPSETYDVKKAQELWAEGLKEEGKKKVTLTHYTDDHGKYSSSAANVNEYWKNMRNAQSQLTKDAAVTPLYNMTESHLVRPNLKGVLWHSVGEVDYTRAYFK